VNLNLDLNHLRTFKEVIAGRSFSAAASKLGLTQPGVSLQIRRLEQRLGIRLIERVGKRAFPTAVGKDFLEFAQRVVEQTDEITLKIKDHAEGHIGRIRIGTGATACTYLLPSVLNALRSSHPRLELAIVTGNASEMLDAVEGNAIDLALVTLPAKRRALAVREIIEDPLIAILPGSQKPASRGVRPQFMSQQNLILYEPGGTTRSLIDSWFSSAGIKPRPAMEVDNVEATKRFVAAGLGCSIVPSMALVGGCKDGLAVHSLTPKLSRRLGLILRHDKILDSGLRVVLKVFERHRRRTKMA
jgi:DNA-binding transcriptional LysR family regulator